MRVLVAGGSGFLGSHLVTELRERGHTVTQLVRRPPGSADQVQWDPYAGTLDPEVVKQADVVVNLAGSPTAGNVFSKKWARNLRESRVTTTRVLAEAVAVATTAGSPTAFVAGNGISVYGEHGSAPLDEHADSRGDALLTDVSREWEAATRPASDAGARVAVVRTAPVMDRRSPPLKQLLPLFRLALGTRLGNGQQYFPMISLRDWVGAVVHLVEHGEASGPFNVCCPRTPTNAEFTAALGQAVGRPAFLAVPAFVLDRAAGAMAPEVLRSMNTEPAALVASGYVFRDEDVHEVLASALRP